MPCTRKEILSIGREIANKFFHKKKVEEVTINGWVVVQWYGNAMFGTEKPVKRGDTWKFETPCWCIELTFPLSKELNADSLDRNEPTPATVTIKIEK